MKVVTPMSLNQMEKILAPISVQCNSYVNITVMLTRFCQLCCKQFPLYLPGFVMPASRARKSPIRAHVKDATALDAQCRSNSLYAFKQHPWLLTCWLLRCTVAYQERFQVDRSMHSLLSIPSTSTA